MRLILLCLATFCCTTMFAQNTHPQEDRRVRLTTEFGDIVLRLYKETPLHSNNFYQLVQDGFYDSLLFHRIIPDFMIQGGDPDSKNAVAGQRLGMGGANMERIPAEFNPALIHKKGALAAARDNNPQRASSACQFYIVEGKPLTDQELDALEARRGTPYTPEQRALYKTLGGTPMLDMNYTVFGEVEEGLEVIDKIIIAERDPANRPLKDIRMKIKVIR